MQNSYQVQHSTGVTASISLIGARGFCPNGLRDLLDVAIHAEQVGVGEVVLPDHVVMGAHPDTYPFGTLEYGDDELWPEPLITLSALGAVTSTIRLATSVLVAPLRPALLLAKMVGTLDSLTNGRVELGVGSGWQAEEYESLGVPFEARGQRLLDTIRACQAAWGPGPSSFSSSTVEYDRVWCRPATVSPVGRFWLGGPPTERTMRKIAELGVGWPSLATSSDDEILAACVLLSEAFERAGRDPSTAEVRAMVMAPGPASDPAGRALADRVERLVLGGVTRVSFVVDRFARDRDEAFDFIESVPGIVSTLVDARGDEGT